MMSEVIYIAETKEFIVDGQTIKESSLTPSEVATLKLKVKNLDLLTGNKEASCGQVLV